MSKPALLVLVCVGLLASAATGAEPTAEKQAEGALAVAEAYVAADEPAKAEPFVASALQALPHDEAVRKRAVAILSRIAEQRREEAQARQRFILAEARRLADEGRADEARKLIQLDTLAAPLLPQAANRLKVIHRNWLAARLAKLLREGWLIDVALALVIVAILALLLGLWRRLIAWRHRGDWLVTGIEDDTKLGIGVLAFERLRRWSEEPPAAPAPSVGLLTLEALRVQSVPRIKRDQPQIALSAALAELPNLGQVNLGAVAKALEAIRSWVQGKRPTISIAAYTLDQQVVVRLTRSSRDGKIHTVGASEAKSVDGFTAAADSASFKMYYLLGNDALLPPQAEAADKLRFGLDQLGRYISGRDPASLPTAYETFREVHAESPGFEEAQLYEGIALDLLERHDEAERVFGDLAEHGHDDDVKTKSRYNRAISKFRKYKPDELKLAITMLDELIGPEIARDLAATPPRLDRLAASPITALAVAAKANAIAHKPIFWQTLVFGGDRVREPEEILERKVAARDTVFGWQREAEVLTSALSHLDEQAVDQLSGWDMLARTQLRWSIHNARGNVLLNIADKFLQEPHVPRDSWWRRRNRSYADEPEQRAKYLQSAYREFETCKMLLPPGVETLTNLATTLLSLSRTPEARSYAEAARQVNPDYEYAYLRLAQTWVKDGDASQVRETLRSFKRPPKISEFKRLFDEYAVEPRPA